MKRIYYSELESIIGSLTLFATDTHLCYVQFGTFAEHEQSVRKWLDKQLGSFSLQPEQHRELHRGEQVLELEQQHELHSGLQRELHHGEQALELEQPVLMETKIQLEQYFSGSRQTFDLPLKLYGTAFQQKVWEELLRIAYGSTKSYKQVAEALDHPRAVRAIGMANNRNPLPVIVPCHRVIGHNGRLVGYGGGLDIKEKLLALESASQEAESFA